MTAGAHPIVLDYFQVGGYVTLNLYLSYNGGPSGPVDPSWLWHTPPSPPSPPPPPPKKSPPPPPPPPKRSPPPPPPQPPHTGVGGGVPTPAQQLAAVKSGVVPMNGVNLGSWLVCHTAPKLVPNLTLTPALTLMFASCCPLTWWLEHNAWAGLLPVLHHSKAPHRMRRSVCARLPGTTMPSSPHDHSHQAGVATWALMLSSSAGCVGLGVVHGAGDICQGRQQPLWREAAHDGEPPRTQNMEACVHCLYSKVPALTLQNCQRFICLAIGWEPDLVVCPEHKLSEASRERPVQMHPSYNPPERAHNHEPGMCHPAAAARCHLCGLRVRSRRRTDLRAARAVCCEPGADSHDTRHDHQPPEHVHHPGRLQAHGEHRDQCRADSGRVLGPGYLTGAYRLMSSVHAQPQKSSGSQCSDDQTPGGYGLKSMRQDLQQQPSPHILSEEYETELASHLCEHCGRP